MLENILEKYLEFKQSLQVKNEKTIKSLRREGKLIQFKISWKDQEEDSIREEEPAKNNDKCQWYFNR